MERRQPSRTRRALLAGLIVVAVAGTAAWWHYSGRESTGDAQIDGHIVPVASRVEGTVESVQVRDNQRVTAGTVLVVVDPKDYRVALQKAEADYAAAVATVSGARAGAPITSTTTASQVETANTQPPQVATCAQSAEARLAQAEAALAQARLNLQYTTIAAPTDGIVSKKSVEPGQVIQPGQPLLAIVPLDDVWVTANFKETQLRDVRVGQPVLIDVDAYGTTYRGRVESIAAATGARFSLLPPENATGNFVKVVQRVPVRITLEQYDPAAQVLRPGMSVEATILTR